MYAVFCKCEWGNTIYLWCLFQLCLALPWCCLPLEIHRSCHWLCSAGLACCIINIIWAFWKAWSQWDTECTPLILKGAHLLKSSNAGLSLTPLSHRFFYLYNSHAGSGDNLSWHWSKQKTMPTQWLLLFFHVVLSILVCFVWTVLHIHLSAEQLKRAASVL